MAEKPASERNLGTLLSELERWLLSEIKREHPNWVEPDGGCPKCHAYYERLGTLGIEESPLRTEVAR